MLRRGAVGGTLAAPERQRADNDILCRVPGAHPARNDRPEGTESCGSGLATRSYHEAMIRQDPEMTLCEIEAFVEAATSGKDVEVSCATGLRKLRNLGLVGQYRKHLEQTSNRR